MVAEMLPTLSRSIWNTSRRTSHTEDWEITLKKLSFQGTLFISVLDLINFQSKCFSSFQKGKDRFCHESTRD
jgi:hypothetical protein